VAIEYDAAKFERFDGIVRFSETAAVLIVIIPAEGAERRRVAYAEPRPERRLRRADAAASQPRNTITGAFTRHREG
jgi:hypothetical protein